MKPLEKLIRNNTHDCLWPYLLNLIKSKPEHAYVLRRKIEEKFDFRPGNVTAYRVLYSLKKEGMVMETKSGRKTIYKITNKGRKEIDNCIKFYKERVAFLSK